MIENQVDRVEKIAAWIKTRLNGAAPGTAVIMGSGLSESVPELANRASVPYAEIPGFLKSTVQGHAGNLVTGEYKGTPVAFMQGRFHYYEGHPISDLAVPVRVLWKLGVKNLVVTAAVGSVKKSVKPGDLVVLKDHINYMGVNPLRGTYDPAFGKMFPDMTEPYDPGLRAAAMKVCKNIKIRAHEGVYLAGGGPSYETAAEIRAFRLMGADVVGMSTVPEVIAARQLNLRVLGLSWITNLATGISAAPLSHQEVIDQGKKVAVQFKRLLEELLPLAEFKK